MQSLLGQPQRVRTSSAAGCEARAAASSGASLPSRKMEKACASAGQASLGGSPSAFTYAMFTAGSPAATTCAARTMPSDPAIGFC